MTMKLGYQQSLLQSTSRLLSLVISFTYIFFLHIPLLFSTMNLRGDIHEQFNFLQKNAPMDDGYFT